MPRQALWHDGQVIVKGQLDWSSLARSENALDMIRAVKRHKGVIVFASKEEDKLLPRSSIEDSICIVSEGFGFDDDGEFIRLQPSGALRCVTADVGKYIRIRHVDKVKAVAQHPLTQASATIMYEDDTRSDVVLYLSSVCGRDDPNDVDVTLGKIIDCITNSHVTVDVTEDAGCRDYFEIYVPDSVAPTCPNITSFTTGFEAAQFPESGNAWAWLKVDWTESIDASGILKYEVQFILYTNGEPNWEQAWVEDVSVGDPLPLTLTIDEQQIMSGTLYGVRVRAIDNSHDRNKSDWSPIVTVMAGWGTAPVLGPLTLTSDELLIMVSWTSVVDATGYQIKWREGVDFNWDDVDPDIQFHDNMGQSNSTFSFTATPHSIIYVKVRAYDGADQFSNISEGYKEVGKWYAPPRRLKATTGVDGSTWIKASWGDQGNDMTAWYGGGGWDFDITSNRWTVGEWEPVVMNGVTCYYWLALNHRPTLYVYPEDMFIVTNDAYRLKIDAIEAWLVDAPSYIISPQAWDYEVKLEYFDETGTYIIPGSETYHRTHRVNLRRFYIRPTEHYWVLVPELQLDNLVAGRKYRIHVRSVGSEGVEFATEWVGPVDIVAGLPDYQLTMSQVEVITLGQGARVQWPAVPEAVGYEFVYTLDGSTPDFDDPGALIVFTTSLSYDLMPPAGTIIKVKARCYDQYGLISENVTEAEGVSGGIIVEGEEQALIPQIDFTVWNGDVTEHPATDGHLVLLNGAVSTYKVLATADFTGALSSLHWTAAWDTDAALRVNPSGDTYEDVGAWNGYVAMRVFSEADPNNYIEFPMFPQSTMEIDDPVGGVIVQQGDHIVLQLWFLGVPPDIPGWDADAVQRIKYRVRNWSWQVHALPVVIYS